MTGERPNAAAISIQRTTLYQCLNLARKKLTARQLRWALGHPLFAAIPTLRRRYSIATQAIDIRNVSELVHESRTETRIELSPPLVAYFRRFAIQSGCTVDGTTLVLPYQLLIFRARPAAQLAHTGALIDLATGAAIDLTGAARKVDALTAKNNFRPFLFRNFVRIPGPAFSLLPAWNAHQNFAHFILERFRLLLAALEAVPALRTGTVIMRDTIPPFQRAALDQLTQRYPGLKLREVGPDVRLEFAALHVPVEPEDHGLTWFARPGQIHAVRDIYRDAYGLTQSNSVPGSGHRLYLSRNRQKLRRVLNEDAVISCLVARGFAFVQPELLAHRDQAQLFQAATDIVTPSGSAITNIIFCEPGTRLVLTGPIDVHEPFWVGLALAMGLDFTFIPGSPAGLRLAFTVEPAALTRALDGNPARI